MAQAWDEANELWQFLIISAKRGKRMIVFPPDPKVDVNKEGNQTSARAYWSNNGFAANVIYDVPNEILMVPEEWGTASVE